MTCYARLSRRATNASGVCAYCCRRHTREPRCPNHRPQLRHSAAQQVHSASFRQLRDSSRAQLMRSGRVNSDTQIGHLRRSDTNVRRIYIPNSRTNKTRDAKRKLLLTCARCLPPAHKTYRPAQTSASNVDWTQLHCRCSFALMRGRRNSLEPILSSNGPSDDTIEWQIYDSMIRRQNSPIIIIPTKSVLRVSTLGVRLARNRVISSRRANIDDEKIVWCENWPRLIYVPNCVSL